MRRMRNGLLALSLSLLGLVVLAAARKQQESPSVNDRQHILKFLG